MKHINILVLILTTALLGAAEEVPAWALHGILAVETSSFYNPDGTITYVNHKRGRDGEIGPFQITYGAYLDIKKPGDSFARIATDTAYAEEMTLRRLLWLQEHMHTSDWDRIVRAYNVGIGGVRKGRGRHYLSDVKAWAERWAPETLVVPAQP